VVYRPLQRILHISSDTLTAAANAIGIAANNYQRDTGILSAVLAGNSDVTAALGDSLARVTEFASHMSFFGIDLTQIPKMSLAPEALPLLIFPVFSMKASGQQMQTSMKVTMYVMPLMFVYISFTMPVAFSLYYTISNILMTIQSEVMRRVYDPEKVKAQVLAEIEKKQKEQRRGVKNTTVQVVDAKTGEVTEKSLSASEMNKRRLDYARKLDEEKYAGERTEPLSVQETAQDNGKTAQNGGDTKEKEE
jgi:YidC/Oxa1 family membrane protein insertase